jgi:hypothetical protein
MAIKMYASNLESWNPVLNRLIKTFRKIKVSYFVSKERIKNL